MLLEHRAETVVALRDEWERLVALGGDAIGKAPDVAFAHAIDAMSTALQHPHRDGGMPPPLGIEAGLIFVAAVRKWGSFLGSSRHAGRESEKFHDAFLRDYAGRRCFADDRFGENLTERPIVGVYRPEWPCWGGFTQSEIATLLNVYARHGEEDPAQTEVFETWMLDVVEALEDAAKAGTDLVAIYL